MLNKKKRIALLIIISLLISCFSCPVYAEGDVSDTFNKCGDDLVWTFDPSLSSNLSITGSGDMYDYSDESDVPWNDYKDKIENIVFSSGITHIGGKAFSGTSVSHVSLPDPVVSIGKDAFSDCEALTKAELPEGLETIDDNAFANCASLSEINFPGSLKSIGEMAFNYCDLKIIELPEGLERIGAIAFSGCQSVSMIDIPSTVTELGSDAFSFCYGLKECNIYADNITTIPQGLFAACSNLEAVYMMVSVKQIERWAFGVVDDDSLSDSKLMNVYFDGTVDEWKAIRIDRTHSSDVGVDDGYGGSNDPLFQKTTTIHCSDGKFYPGSDEEKKVRVSGISLDRDSAELPLGERLELKAFVSPDNADNKTVFWKSDNIAVAEVDKDGVVTAKGAGKALITVTTEDGAHTADCAIKVVTMRNETFVNTGGKAVTLIHDYEHNTYKTEKGLDVLVLSENGISGNKAPEYEYTSKRVTPGKGSYVVYNGVLYSYKRDYSLKYRHNKKVGSATGVLKWKKRVLSAISGSRTVPLNISIIERNVSDNMINVRVGRRGIKGISVTADGATMRVRNNEYSLSPSENSILISFSGNFKGDVMWRSPLNNYSY